MKDSKYLEFLSGPFFVTCCESDCHSGIYGPLFSYEDAVEECNVGSDGEYGCQKAHFMTTKVPKAGVELGHPAIYNKDNHRGKSQLWADWMITNRNKTKQETDYILL